MNRLALVSFLLLVSCAGMKDATLKEVLDVAAGSTAEDLRPRLEAAARTIDDPALRKKTLDALDEIVAAARFHQRSTVLAKELTELGGKATFEPGGPAWMREAAGDPPMALFDRVVGVSLSAGVNAHAKDYKLNTRISDDWTGRLAGLPDLRTLNLENTDVKGAGLRTVGTLATLESLNLTLCPVTDEPLTALAGLTRLKVLGLASTKITGTAMKDLQELRKLENLNCHNTPVNDAGLEG
ncbi:MAG: hypothetical protein HY293_04365, partial [Planctomycetes bacterium]|nr:hypothetical protein [Planctomycetota bacterium]